MEADRYTCSTLMKGMHLAGCTVFGIHRIVTLLRRIEPVSRPKPGLGYNAGYVGSPTNAEWLEVIFNTLLDAGVSVRDLDCMTEFFTLMRDFEIESSAVTFSTLIRAFGQARLPVCCHEAWPVMRSSAIKPTLVTSGCYIGACIRNKKITRLFAVPSRSN